MPDKSKKKIASIDIVSFVILLLTLSVFFYFVFYRNSEKCMRHFQTLTQKAKTDLGEIKKLKVPAKQDTDQYTLVTRASRSDLTAFLEELNTEFVQSDVELDNILKSEIDDYTYNVVAYAPFSKLIKFLYHIEQSHLAIQDLDIHPYSADKNLVNMTLKLIRDEMSAEEKASFKSFQGQFPPQIRDPFKKRIIKIDPNVKHIPKPINLTYKCKLTGIGVDKDRYATIDHKNYYVGDIFQGKKIVRIQNDRVDLVSGNKKYFVTFRFKKTSKRK